MTQLHNTINSICQSEDITTANISINISTKYNYLIESEHENYALKHLN